MSGIYKNWNGEHLHGDGKPVGSSYNHSELSPARLLAGERVCENDFVFLDHAHRPYRVRKSKGKLWLYYWSKSKTWVSLRKCTDDEAMQYIEGALEPAMAKYYEAGVPFLAS